jgi:hypothetical protein
MADEFEVNVPDKATDPAGYIMYLESKLAEVTSLGEAGGIAFCTVSKMSADETGKMHKVEFNVTGRGLTTESAIRNLVGGIKYAQDKLKMHPWRVDEYSQPAPQQSQLQPPATGAAPALPKSGAPQAPAAVQPPATQPAQSTDGGIVIASTMKVAPRADGKAEVGFFASGHKFADIKITKTFAELSALLTGATGAEWTAGHFGVIAEYPVSFRITWVPSTNLNKDGNPYKNLAKIENA